MARPIAILQAALIAASAILPDLTIYDCSMSGWKHVAPTCCCSAGASCPMQAADRSSSPRGAFLESTCCSPSSTLAAAALLARGDGDDSTWRDHCRAARFLPAPADLDPCVPAPPPAAAPRESFPLRAAASTPLHLLCCVLTI